MVRQVSGQSVTGVVAGDNVMDAKRRGRRRPGTADQHKRDEFRVADSLLHCRTRRHTVCLNYECQTRASRFSNTSEYRRKSECHPQNGGLGIEPIDED